MAKGCGKLRPEVDRTDPTLERLRESFEDEALLRLALTHGSYVNEHPEASFESNERLEFLGDALVGLAVAEEVYSRFPDLPEGQLTAIRSALARGETLARVADSLGLGEGLSMGRGEEASGGRSRESNLAAAFESVVGALFLDRGYQAAHDFVLETLADELVVAGERPVLKNPKSLLQELAQGNGEGLPSYRILETAGEHHPTRFTAEAIVSGRVIGQGTGRRKSLAEQEAARNALKTLGHEA